MECSLALNPSPGMVMNLVFANIALVRTWIQSQNQKVLAPDKLMGDIARKRELNNDNVIKCLISLSKRRSSHKVIHAATHTT